MSEKNLWVNLRKKMVPQFWPEATRHEDAYQRGIADVSFVQGGRHGWMELKHRSMKPVRDTTIVRLDHYTDEQRIWLLGKGDAGGMTFLLLQLDRDYLLFDHERAQSVGHLVAADLYNTANWYSENKLDAAGLWSGINVAGL